jgi:alpha-L-fucosidase
MSVNHESIYGTKASPFKSLSWGRCTQKPITGGTRLYLHVFDWPTDARPNDSSGRRTLIIPNLGSPVINCYDLAGKKKLKAVKPVVIM